jgi:adenosine deaminase
MSGVTLTDEYEKAHSAIGFSWEELVQVARMGFEGGFAGGNTRRELVAGSEGAT